MRWWSGLCALLMLLTTLGAAERELAVIPHDEVPGTRVALRVVLLEGPELAVTFTPVPHPGGKALHLYGTQVPKSGVDGIGRPTLVEIPPGQGLRATGELRIDPPVPVHDLGGLPVFADGPVTLRLPVALPPGDGSPVEATISVTYMSCTDVSCNRPVTDRELTIMVPSDPQAAETATPADAGALRAMGEAVAGLGDQLDQLQLAVTELRDDLSVVLRRGGIAWRHGRSVEEVEALIAEAHAAGRAALLDFTGPSCANCQDMKKSVFLDRRVVAAWNTGLPIEIDTDRSSALAVWQRQRFDTDARPLYVRIDPDGEAERWSLVFSPGNEAVMEDFLAFLAGGAGADSGTGEGWWQFLLLAIGGGLFTLLMPCTYPMIPLTVNFFTKQASEGRRLVPLALAYSGGIMACFVGIGVIVSQVLQASVANMAGNPWINLGIALLFVVLGLSLLGAFFLRLPAGLQRLAGGGSRGGYIGALLMGLAFAITAFTCTAPFAGAVLAEGVRDGDILRPIIGMTVYASAIAVPFFVLAIAPGALARMPRAGSWMNEFKHVGGMVEIAAALKFIVIADVAWDWGIFGRTNVLAIWTMLTAVAGFYALGWLRFEGDERIESIGVWRLILALVWLSLAIWFAAGLFGAVHLGVIESFFPADAAPIPDAVSFS